MLLLISMIEPKEINKVAATNRVNDRQIEKDYVLSGVLFAISKNQRCSTGYPSDASRLLANERETATFAA